LWRQVKEAGAACGMDSPTALLTAGYSLLFGWLSALGCVDANAAGEPLKRRHKRIDDYGLSHQNEMTMVALFPFCDSCLYFDNCLFLFI
jgi:hypothetical protein